MLTQASGAEIWLGLQPNAFQLKIGVPLAILANT